MPSSSKHPPPKVYANCYRTAEGVEPLARYGNNVYHQAEVIYSMLFAALSDKAAPAKIFWRMPLLPWSRGMLDLLRKAPFASATQPPTYAEIVVGNTTRLPRLGCRPFGSRPPGQFFKTPAAARKVQRAVLQGCGIRERIAPREPRSVVYMPRRGEGLQSKTWRNFAEERALLDALESAVPSAARRIRVVGTPSGSSPVCKQIELWHSTDVLLTPNGAHFVNAPFLAFGSVLLEGVPWGMREYVGQAHITRWASGVHHLRLHSDRPPRSKELIPFRHVGSEEECAASEMCRRKYRDRALLYVDASAMLQLLKPALALVRSGCRDAKNWKNSFGRTCADYATPVPASQRGDKEKMSGGWCAAGKLKPEAKWAGGKSNGWPERNCCACGRQAQS